MTAFADYTLHRLTQGAPDNDGGLLTLSSPTTVVSANVDTGNGSIPFGFTFNFDGTDYTSATAYSDGWLAFGGSSFGNPYNNDQFDDSNATIGLFPWWGDLRTATSTGYVRYEQFGSAPNRHVVIDYLCYGYFNHNSTNNRTLPFQIVLRETTNNIEFRYGTATTSGSPTSGDGVIGARVDTRSSINGNIREFSETTGTPDINGGVSTTPVDLALNWTDGNDWPGDPTNALEAQTFNFHYRATAVAVPVDPPVSLPRGSVSAIRRSIPLPTAMEGTALRTFLERLSSSSAIAVRNARELANALVGIRGGESILVQPGTYYFANGISISPEADGVNIIGLGDVTFRASGEFSSRPMITANGDRLHIENISFLDEHNPGFILSVGGTMSTLRGLTFLNCAQAATITGDGSRIVDCNVAYASDSGSSLTGTGDNQMLIGNYCGAGNATYDIEVTGNDSALVGNVTAAYRYIAGNGNVAAGNIGTATTV
jgi:hypothetical protein